MTDGFLNRYRCDSCWLKWEDVWSCMCDGQCPGCGRKAIQPSMSTHVGHRWTEEQDAAWRSDEGETEEDLSTGEACMMELSIQVPAVWVGADDKDVKLTFRSDENQPADRITIEQPSGRCYVVSLADLQKVVSLFGLYDEKEPS